MKTDNRPWYWIPILSFASGLPYAIIISVSVIMYKNLGINNEDIGIYTSLLYLPWVIKPLWSPFIDLYSTKRKWFLAMQLIIAIAFLIVGLTIPLNHFFVISLAIFWVAAFASASNDVASDGFYLIALEKDQQSFFLGIRSTFYRLSMLTGNGLIVIIGIDRILGMFRTTINVTGDLVACVIFNKWFGLNLDKPKESPIQ